MLPHSTSKHTADPLVDHFTAIFDTASTEYKTVTGKRLDAHPFAIQFEDCNDPEAVSDALRTQALAFSNVPQGKEKLMTWLDPTIHILFSYSATLEEWAALPFSPAKTICIGISVLLQAVGNVTSSCNKLIHVFERIQFFLERLKIYSGIPLTDELGKLLGRILAELLSVLAFSTKEMAEWRIKLFFMRLLGKNDDVEDALSRLDLLTKYSLMMLARNLALPDGFTRLLLSDETIIDRTKVIVPVAGERARTQCVETLSKPFPGSTGPSISRRCSILSTVTATSTLTATSTITATSTASSVTAVSTVTDASWKQWPKDDKIWSK